MANWLLPNNQAAWWILFHKLSNLSRSFPQGYTTECECPQPLGVLTPRGAEGTHACCGGDGRLSWRWVCGLAPVLPASECRDNCQHHTNIRSEYLLSVYPKRVFALKTVVQLPAKNLDLGCWDHKIHISSACPQKLIRCNSR